MGNRRMGLGRLEKLMEEMDRSIDLEGSDVTVNSLIADEGVTVTSGGHTITAGGLTVTAGVVAFREAHPVIRHQATETTLADSTAIITGAFIKTQILKMTPGDARSKATDTAANLVSALSLTSNGDSVDFSIINLSTTTDHILTVTGGTGVTLVGAMTFDPHVAGEDTSGSSMLRLRRTGAAAVTIYRLT